jgi:hypothetical protein
MIVLAVDPGKASGIAIITWDKAAQTTPVLSYSNEVQPDQFGDEITQGLSYLTGPEDFSVVCESFTINAQTVRNSQAPWSLENIGVLKYLCRTHGYDPLKIAFQTPVNAKTMFPNPALRQVGVWHKGGEGHANDAIRHGLLRLVKMGWKPVELLTPKN